MTDAQIWTVIGVLAAALIGTITVTTQLMMRTITAQIGGLRNEMTVRFEKVDLQFEAVDRRFETVDRRFEAVDRRFDGMDQRLGRVESRLDRVETRLDGFGRDIQAITRRVFPGDST